MTTKKDAAASFFTVFGRMSMYFIGMQLLI